MQTGGRLLVGLGVVALGVGSGAVPLASATARQQPRAAVPAPRISLHASPNPVRSGHPVRLRGTVTGAPAASAIRLLKSPYPFRSSRAVRVAVAGPQGSFSFVVWPDRRTLYRAVLSPTGPSASVVIDVTPRTIIKLAALPLGRAGVTIVTFHPRDLHWGAAKVRWAFSSGRSGRLVPAAPTFTRRLSPYVTVARTSIALPAGRFEFQACFHVPGARALLDPRRPRRCSGRGYAGAGSLPVGFPTPTAVARAGRYLDTRVGVTGLAVLDSEGRLSGAHLHRRFITGSVVKAMLLVAYLRRLDARGQRRIDPYSASFLYPMIHVSDNNAATMTQSFVGDTGLYAVARAAGMTDFSVSGPWGSAMLSPADQAQFFFEMDSLIPHEFVGYAHFLLSTIASYESWGIPAVARPRGYQVFFKGGWRPTGLGQLVHQIARLQGHGHTFAIAVMTDGDPTMGYGIETLQGATAALLR